MAALECEWLAAQSQLDDPPTLLEAGARLAHVDAVGVILQLRGAAPNPQMQFAVRESVEHQDLFSDAHRIVPREHQHRSSEAEFGTGSCHVRHVQQRTGRRIVVGEMVLQETDPMVAEFARHMAAMCRLPARKMVGKASERTTS